MIEKIIETISPNWALERERARTAKKILSKRRYEGAAKGRRTDGWIANGTDANKEVYSGLVTLRNRSRDMCRNNPYAVAAQSVIVNSVVGDGIEGSIRANMEENREAKALKDAFSSWSNSLGVDADGKFNFYGLQGLIEGSRFESGEVLIRRIYPKSGDYKHAPLKLQVLESDFLDISKNETRADGSKIIQGIEVDRVGKVKGYHLFNTHPGSGEPSESSLVPAVDVIHYLRQKRPGQMRAVPDLAPVMITLNDLDGYQDAQLIKQKISACFTAFVTKTSSGFGDSEPMAISSAFEPGIIEELNEGEDIKFSTPPTAGDYTEFTKATLRKVASGIGVTYEALTSDYSNANFSQSRMAERLFNNNVQVWRWNYFIPQVLDRVWEWFLEAAMLEGIIKQPYPINWTPPKKELLNPTEDNNADIAAIRGGLKAWQSTIRSRGEDPEEVARQIKEDMDLFDRLGILLDSDPRKLMKAGMLQATVTAPPQDNDQESVDEENK